MEQVCPLCRAGRLEEVPRVLEYEGREFASGSYRCTACRESLLSGDQLTELRRAIREAGLAASDAEIDGVVERLLLRAD